MNFTAKLTDKTQKLKLVAVTKNRSVEEIENLNSQIKLKRIAENRLKEAEIKFPLLSIQAEKHFIGKLQSRKVYKIVELFDLIQSVENIEQAKKIASAAKDLSKVPYPIFLQVNISGQESRSGCSIEAAKGLIESIQSIPELKLTGVMGMASQSSQEQIKEEYKTLKGIQAELEECCMGMSSNYNFAIEEGSTMLRLGSLLFKEPLPKLPEFD